MTMKMHVLSGGRLTLRKGMYLPEAERSETFDAPVSCYLIRHPQGNVLFDTGCHPDALAHPAERWGSMAKVMMPVGSPQNHLLSSLGDVGVKPDDIDLVVNSHLHSDHCGCNGYFRRATAICHARELESATAADARAQGYLSEDFTPPRPFRTIENQHDLFGDGRVVLVPIPGHTPGSVGAVVGLERDGEFFLASDAVALEVLFEREVMPRNTWNATAAAASIDEVRRIRERGTTVLCGHDPAQWERLRKGVDAYA
jgi:glyoxylase-like metal-dependent hydrolase (beta-lactamase superfamily II)